MARRDPELRAHKDWMGLLQPVGLVVSPPALVKAQAVPSQNITELQQRLIALVENPPTSVFGDDDEPYIGDFLSFAKTVLGWASEDIAGAEGGPDLAEGLELVLPDFNETLRPTFAVVDSMGDNDTLLLVQVVARGTDLDVASADDEPGWSASPQIKLERLLREVKVPAGLLCNGDALRLVYAPSGESSGHLTFPVAGMCEVSGRPILGALHMLLSARRVIGTKTGRRLLDILSDSRKYQAEVSNALSDQVLGALWDLIRGFQAADPDDGHRIFDRTAREEPEHIYGGLLTMLMRLIFVLYAEDQALMPKGGVYANNYSVGGLYDRLRADAGRYPDTMDQRYGAYAWLLSLFRLIFDGGGHGGMRLPKRHGQLFNPDEYPFLEGRPHGVLRVMDEKFDAPRVSDGCIYRVLDALLMLDVDGDGIADRLSYRALDVEQIGSVYEAMMGYEVERAFGPSIAVRPKHIVINVADLLEQEGGKRKKWLKDHADSELTGASLTALKAAETAEDVVAALARRVSPRSLDAAGIPRLMAPGSLYLQPGEERRRTGSHYTPRELTEPIVSTTLRPVLEALGDKPTPEQVLDLKVCDPAMGSGAFLVEATRQLAEHLLNAWEVHDAMPKVPADEEPILHARRLVAQRCIYGVDKNPFAVNLAKLSIWLVTLAKDHAFTFLDHSLKHGDSLVGLTKKQIAAFHWKTDKGPAMDLFEEKLKQDLEDALGWRDALQGLDEGDYNQKKEAWWEAENALADARLIGDLCIAAFFGADKDKAREELRGQYRSKVEAWRANEANRNELEGIVEELRGGEKPLPPLHWEIEFPEVFGRENPGFDAMVGNPPFAGKNTIAKSAPKAFQDWLKSAHPESHGNADLVAHFYRRSFNVMRDAGCFGLIATNTIRQGDTRATGLRWICCNGGTIYHARRRLKWPGAAAVIVSVIHIRRGSACEELILDGTVVPIVTAYLFHQGGHENPSALSRNGATSFQGPIALGMGFTFDDSDKKGVANTLSTMRGLIAQDANNRDRIHPYIGGNDLLDHPEHQHSRYIINLSDLEEADARTQFPALMKLVEEKVRPARLSQNDKVGKEKWWQYLRPRPELYKAIAGLESVLMHSFPSKHLAFAFVPSSTVVAAPHCVFALTQQHAFGILQSRGHEVWVRFFGSTQEDRLRYTISDCFETFPFPENWQVDPTLEAAGKTYYEFRADLMVRNDEGLTKTYNRFHDPNNHKPDIVKLRELHAAMDRAVLDAYGWDDISTDCEFLLDYEIDEETWGNKKKPYRYRWPEAVHDEVLARLLDLNQKRYTEEVAAGLHDKKGKKKATAKKPKAKAAPASNATLPLFASMNPSEDA